MESPEQIRLNEAIFCMFVQKLLKKYNNPITVIDFLSNASKLAGCNEIILNNILSIIFTADKRYIPNKKELVYLMKKSNYSVRRICKLARISMQTYYRIIEPSLFVEPKFSPIQYAEMMKFFEFFKDIFNYLEAYF